MKYFNKIETLEELKKEYHRLVMMHHPDIGGKLEIMQDINQEYEFVFQKVKNKHKNKDGEFYTKDTEEVASEFIDLISELLKLNNIHVEIIGSFVWVSGHTKPHKEILKTLGLKWHSKKQCWYLSPSGYRRFGKNDYSMDEIRSMYGVQYSKSIYYNQIES